MSYIWPKVNFNPPPIASGLPLLLTKQQGYEILHYNTLRYSLTFMGTLCLKKHLYLLH